MQSEQTNLCRFVMSLSLYIHKLIILQTETYNVYVVLTYFSNIFLRENISAASAGLSKSKILRILRATLVTGTLFNHAEIDKHTIPVRKLL